LSADPALGKPLSGDDVTWRLTSSQGYHLIAGDDFSAADLTPKVSTDQLRQRLVAELSFWAAPAGRIIASHKSEPKISDFFSDSLIYVDRKQKCLYYDLRTERNRDV
jgi:hypothetical protein